MNLIKQIKRIFLASRNILHKIFGKATHKTSVAFKTIGATMATVVAGIMVLLLLALLLIIAIPVSLIGPNQYSSTADKTSHESI